MKIVLFSLYILLACSISAGAQLPKTEIWVFDLREDVTGYKISNPTKVKVGDEYNNQPYFTQDGQTMYFVSNRKKGAKTDIYKYDFQKRGKKIKRITNTKNEAEYSPRLTPGGDRISCVRVAKDTITQNMCTYDLNGRRAEILFPEIKTFGYYCWKSQIDLLAFHVPEPFQFIKHNFPYNKHDTLERSIGRCIKKIHGKILYVDKSDSTKWYIKILNNKRLSNREYNVIPNDKILSSALQGAEDFDFIRGRDMVMAKDGFIYIKRKIFQESNQAWTPAMSLNFFKLYDVYRIAVSPNANRLAVVARVQETDAME